MPSTRHRLHTTTTVLLAIALTGGATAVLRATHDNTPTTTVHNTGSVNNPDQGARGNSLDPIETDAARKLADLRAQWSADLACRGPNYPARPC